MDGNATSQHHSDVTDFSATTTATSASSHPLQDVELSLSSPIPESSTKTVKKNWVKFDDDANGDDGDANVNSGNNNATASARSATASDAEHNKLSQLPPPPTPAARQSPTTVTATTTTLPNSNRNSHATPMEKNMNKHSAAVAPVQRSTVSSSTVEMDVAPAVLNTESTHVDLNSSAKAQQQEKLRQQKQHQQQYQQQQQPKTSNVLSGSNPLQLAATASSTTTSPLHSQHHHHHSNNGTSNSNTNNNNKSQSVTIPVESTQPMRTIELSTGRIREGFANGDVIVTLLPANTKWPWVTPAIFRPELVPEELMAQGLTLTVEEYVNAMETLVNDYRFTVYNICYKRILVCWILFAFAVLLALLFSGLQGVALFSLGVGWLFLNAAAIFLCMWMKLRLARGLEKCLARVNRQLMRHKILLILDDRGRISCHKVNLCFLYFDSTQCVNYLNEFLEQTEQNGGDAIKAGWEAKLDLDLNDIVIQGNNPVRLSRKQERGMQLYLRYGSRWGMEALRGLVDVTPLDPGRHCGQFQCPCQYIKQHLQCKPRGKLKIFNCIYWVLESERYNY